MRKGGRFIKRKAAPRILAVSCIFTNKKCKASHSFETIQNYFYTLEDTVLEKKVNEGFFKACGAFCSIVSKTLWGFRGGLLTVFNWVAPMASIVFLVGVVSYATNLSYGVSVEFNGEKLGVISEETDYDEAEKALQQRITYVEGNEKVVLNPKLSVQIVRNSNEIVDSNQLVDKMINNSDADLAKAFGIYIDGVFMGAVENRQSVMNSLAAMLAKYQEPGAKSVRFQKSIEYKDGLYLKDSLVDPNRIISTLNTQTQVPAYYTIQESDTPIRIAAKNNLTLSQLISLNPNIENDCKVGGQVVLTRAEAYMPVQVIKDVQYTETLDYETEKVDNNSLYKGNEKVLVKGQEGEASITAEVTYVNGYEVGRTIVSTVVTKQPVNERISVGTKAPAPSKGSTTISGNGKYTWPAAGGYISAYMGDSRGHNGLDIAAPKGTSIFAADSGTVIMSQWYYGYGNCIMIQHPDGFITVYGHQSKLIATKGQYVEKGQLIGLIGSTGQSSGNHLHFEVRSNGRYLNPLNYLK